MAREGKTNRGRAHADNRRRIVAVGNSHLAAIMLGYRDFSELLATDCEVSFLALDEKTLQPPLLRGGMNPAITAALLKAGPDAVVSCIGGNAYNVLGLLNQEPRFDFVLPEEPKLPLQDGAEILPAGAILQTLRARLAKRASVIMRGIAEAISVPFLHLDSPPPIPSAEHILQSPGSHFTRELMERHGISPALLRYKLWRLHSSIVREFCREIGATFVEVPQQAKDPNGMLIDRAWGNDPTHGNSWFGMVMLKEALKCLVHAHG